MTEILALACVITLLLWAVGASARWIQVRHSITHHHQTIIREDS